MTEAKQKILNSAYKLFLSKGVNATSTREIAQHAEVNEVTLFRHFKTKEGLLIACMSEFGPTYALPVLQSLKFSGVLEEDLLIIARCLNRFHSENEEFLRFTMLNLTLKNEHPELINAMISPVIDWLKSVLSKYTPVKGDIFDDLVVAFGGNIGYRSIRKAVYGNAFPYEDDDEKFCRNHAKIFGAAFYGLNTQRSSHVPAMSDVASAQPTT